MEKPESLKKLASDALADPVALAAALDAATENAWRDWLPETVRDFCELSKTDVQQLDKLMAIQVCLTNADLFDTWPLFNHVVIAFNNRRVNFEWLDKPSLPELAWGMLEIGRLAPSGNYSPSVLRYIDTLLLQEGVVWFPWCPEHDTSWADGMTDVEALKPLRETVKRLWESKEIQDAAIGDDGDPKDAVHAQLDALVRCQTYIRALEPA